MNLQLRAILYAHLEAAITEIRESSAYERQEHIPWIAPSLSTEMTDAAAAVYDANLNGQLFAKNNNPE